MTLRVWFIAALMALVAMSGAAQAAHAAGHDAELEAVAECVLCKQADRQDDGMPPPDLLVISEPLPEPVAKAHAAKTALVPAFTATPPGRAPPRLS